jgi:hypothetical protein
MCSPARLFQAWTNASREVKVKTSRMIVHPMIPKAMITFCTVAKTFIPNTTKNKAIRLTTLEIKKTAMGCCTTSAAASNPKNWNIIVNPGSIVQGARTKIHMIHTKAFPKDSAIPTTGWIIREL